MPFDVALTVGIDSVPARKGADEAIKAIESIQRAAAGGFTSVESTGRRAWEEVARAAESAAQRQISAFSSSTSLLQSLSQSSFAPPRAVSGGTLAFHTVSNNLSAAEDVLNLLRRLSTGKGSFTDRQRAVQIGVANTYGLDPIRIRQALELQQQAFDVLRRRELQGRADGGPVTAGKPVVVGEMGPEIFVPQSSGAILPSGVAGAGGAINIHISGTQDPETVARQVVAMINRYAALGKPLLSSSSARSRVRRGG